MKAIILAAGKGKRMRHLTQTVPKPLIKIGRKTVLEHLLDSLPTTVDEIIIVIGYRGDQIRNFVGTTYKGKSVRYVVQRKLNGTAHAVLLARDLFTDARERFFIIYGDELPTRREIRQCLAHTYSWLCHPLSHSIATGVVQLDRNKRIIKIAEKRAGTRPPFISAGGVMLVSAHIFSYRPWRHKRTGEYYLTSMMSPFLRDHAVYAVIGRADLYLSAPDDVDRTIRQ